MTSYLPHPSEYEGNSLTVEDLAERFDVEPRDERGAVMSELFAVALAMDDLHGDDPFKFEGIQRLVRAMATLDDTEGMETTYTVQSDGVEETITAERQPDDEA